MRIRGFSLIELMVVVAISATLAALAFAVYQGYVARSVVVSGIAEIAPGKSGFELKVNDGFTAFSPGDIGLALTTNRCDISLDVPSGTITCRLKGNPLLGANPMVAVTRGSDGSWSCSSNVPVQYRPNGCS